MTGPLSMETFLATFCPGPAETKDAQRRLYRGSVLNVSVYGMHAADLDRLIPQPAREVDSWRDSWYRVVWVLPEQRAVITYCEGDVCVLVASTDDALTAELNEAAGYYGAPLRYE